MSTSELGRGDVIEVQMRVKADGRALADSILVRERGDRTTTIAGRVERVLIDRRVIELRTASGALTRVYVPQDSPETVEIEFKQLRSGDFVRFQGIFLGENRFELTRVVKQAE
jgi:hypothetical protein